MTSFLVVMATVLVAAGLPIPFGQPAPRAPGAAEVPAPPPETEMPEYQMSFEFVEADKGYTLNAILVDPDARRYKAVEVASCGSIDIDSFNSGLFGTSVLCDGTTYSFDVEGLDVVVRSDRQSTPTTTVMTLDPGHAVFNGVPLFMQAGR